MATARTPDLINSSDIERAAQVIRSGGLVVFPTETVYGLGANALNPAAVARIYEVKRRPPTSPLIVHVASIQGAQAIVREWPEPAHALAERFWPGPLTLVLGKQPQIPSVVTAGLDTVGVRMPAHEVALALIRLADVPVAAPSANPFTRLSPTDASHVRAMIGEDVDYILDGGPTPVGIESTVLSLSGGDAVLLRPGMITREDIEEVIGPVSLAGAVEGAHPSPGMHRRHYSPRTPVHLVAEGQLPSAGHGAYLWLHHPGDAEVVIRMPEQPSAYAAALYSTLHNLDARGLDWIAIEIPPEDGGWTAILDRLRRAASSA